MSYRSIILRNSSINNTRRCSLLAGRNLLSNIGVVRSFSTTATAARSPQYFLSAKRVTTDPQIGEYPNVPWVHYEEKDPFKYWDRQGRRNLGDVLHEQDEILSGNAADASTIPIGTAVSHLALFAGGIAVTCLVIGFFREEAPRVKRTYPYQGLSKELGLDASDPNESRKPARDETQLVF
ncbi:hypothetical protein BDF22DRAFT_698316 [Syncephalis plumigaleata]|nr:hypothetical protein BDF22DRAFT_698316 [Syncephalis plumigaleata]